MKKKLLLILMAALLIVTLIPATAMATSTFTVTNGTPAADATVNNGYISVSAVSAAKNETVTVTVYPNTDYQLKSLSYNDGTKDVAITAGAGNTYTFAMPPKAVTVTAEFESLPDFYFLNKALTGAEQASVDGAFIVDDETPYFIRSIKLLKDIDAGAADIIVDENVFLDLNHFNLTTTGKVTNNGVIIVHQENAGVIDYLLYNAPGSYGTKEEVKFPTDASPDYIIPANTFMNASVNTDPVYQHLEFALGNDYLVWNKKVPAGMQLDATYELALGGDIVAPKTAGDKATKVTATHFKLNNNITVGSNDPRNGEAILFVESLYSDFIGDTIGTFDGNGKTITLNTTGKVILSTDIPFNESILVPGVKGLEICKKFNAEEGTVTYYCGKCLQNENCVYAKFIDCDPTAWYHDGVHFCVVRELMLGLDSMIYAPEGLLNRAQIVTILWRLAGYPTVNYNLSFTDVEADTWYTEAIRWAQSNELVLGYNETTFGTNDQITREQLATILMRFAEKSGVNVTAKADLGKYTDVAEISDWAVDAMEWTVASGIITGKTATTLVPGGFATRAETACMIQRFCDANGIR